MRQALGLLLVVAALAAPATAQAAPSLAKVGDFASPTHVTSPPGDPRLFVVEQAGRVKVVSGGATKTFLDISAITNTSGSERGLLSIAFPPDYATSGLSYLYLTGAGLAPARDLDTAHGGRQPQRRPARVRAGRAAVPRHG